MRGCSSTSWPRGNACLRHQETTNRARTRGARRRAGAVYAAEPGRNEETGRSPRPKQDPRSEARAHFTPFFPLPCTFGAPSRRPNIFPAPAYASVTTPPASTAFSTFLHTLPHTYYLADAAFNPPPAPLDPALPCSTTKTGISRLHARVSRRAPRRSTPLMCTPVRRPRSLRPYAPLPSPAAAFFTLPRSPLSTRPHPLTYV